MEFAIYYCWFLVIEGLNGIFNDFNASVFLTEDLKKNCKKKLVDRIR